MKYQRKYPICPFQAKGTKKCNHKGCTVCGYLKCPEKCRLYLEWVELRELGGYKDKVDSGSLEMREEANVIDFDIPNPKRPKRCNKCDKIIRSWNKSGLCSACYKKSIQKKSPTTKFSLYGK